MTSRKRLYIFGSVFGAALILFLTVWLGAQSYFRPRVRQLLQNIIVGGSDSLYRFELGNCRLNVWAGSLSLTDCHIWVDSVRYARMLDSGALPPLTFRMDLGGATVSGFRIWEWFTAKKVDCGSLTIDGARVALFRHPPKENVPKGGGAGELYPVIRSSIHSIRVGTVLLRDLHVSYDNGDSKRPFAWTFERCDVRLGDILVDSSTVADSTRLAYASTMNMQMKGAAFLMGKGLYRLSLARLSYNFQNKTADIKDLSFHPVLDAADFYRRVGHQTDRYAIDAPGIHLSGLNIGELLLSDLLHIDSASLTATRVRITNDRRITPSGQSKIGKYPAQLLQKAPLDIIIRKIRIDRGYLSYGETATKTEKQGLLTFEDVHGSLTNVTNVSPAISADPLWVADLNAGFLGSSPLHAVFGFDLRSPRGKFTVRARLADLGASRLNPVVTALGDASVKDFHLDQLSCFISGDEKGATGSLRMTYTNLHLALSKKPVLSFLVDKLGVHADNPSGSSPERTADDVRQPRDSTKSFFNLIWKTMFGGIKTIALKGVLRPKHK